MEKHEYGLFVGRQEELADLRRLTKSNVASLVVLKGRRRVGKTRLIYEFADDFSASYFFSGLPPDVGVTQKSQKKEFARQLSGYLERPISKEADDWGDLFDELATLSKDEPVLIFLDEVSWMAKGDPTFLGKLKNAWDLKLKRNPNLFLVVCSSISSWIDKNLLSSTGFVGRVSMQKHIKPLSLNESLGFWQTSQASADEKLEILSTLGCIPRYLEEIDFEATAESNIRTLFFSDSGFLFREFDVIFSDLFDKKQSFYKQILLSLSTSCKSQAELSKLFPDISQSRISSALDDLEQAGFIRKDFTWNFGSSELSRLSKVSISDNYVQFYMRNVLPNKERISRGRYTNIDLHQTRSWFQSMGYGFENIVLSNTQLVFSELGITSQHVFHEGPYFQNKTVRQAGCQVDYLVETESRNIFLCEIKYSSQQISNSVLEQVERTVRTIKTPKRYTVRPVLIHFGPVTDKIKYAGLFEKIIDFSRFLQ